MKSNRSIANTLYRMIIAVVSICGFCCMSPYNSSVETNVISSRDSLIQEMVGFIQPGANLSKTERKHIERRIKRFPLRVVRRDTISYFINTAYAVAYYEFYKHDYKKAKRWINAFGRYGMPSKFFTSLLRYSAVGVFARSSLNSKGKLKYKKDKNCWIDQQRLSFSDSLSFDFKRTPAQFVDSYLDDVPMDCNTSTYRKLLTLFKEGGGNIEWLNGYSRRGFIQRCVDAGRADVLRVVNELWGVNLSNFTIGKWGYLEYHNQNNKVNSASISKITAEILSLDPRRNREQIDSLLASGNTLTIGNKVLNILEHYYFNSRFMDVVNACEEYNSYLSSSQLDMLHNYWGLALSNLGKYDEALNHYDIAIVTATKPDVLSTIRLNKACTLGEMGKLEEAISLFISEKDSQITPFKRFVWNDNLGYVYSFINPTIALYYYNQAENFLDSSTMFQERKIRHFCRKAQVLQDNKYLQRMSIDEAMKFTRYELCPDIAKGVAYTELGVFNMSVFDYKEADKNFNMAYKLLEGLSKDDRRILYLNINNALNLYNLNRHEEAAHLLTRQLNRFVKLYGHNSLEYLQILRNLLLVNCEHLVPGFSLKDIYDEYIQLRAKQTYSETNYDDAVVDIAYALYKDDWTTIKQHIDNALKMPITSMQRLELYRMYESACRKFCNSSEYSHLIQEFIPLMKKDVVSGLLLLTGDERRAMQGPLSDVLDGAVCMGSYDNALNLSLFRKGLLFATRQVVESKLAKGRKTKKRYQMLIQQRQELNAAIEYSDTIHIPIMAASVSTLERKLSQMVSSDKEIYRNIDKTLSMFLSALGPDDLAVDFIRYCFNNEYYYGAFVINHCGLVKFVALGEETELKANLNNIWQFLYDGFSKYSNIYFSTDGILNNVGIEYLTFGDGNPVYAKFKMHRVFHLSDIKAATGIGEHIVMVGVSDHNSPIGEGETMDRGSWTDLPNVKYELQLITNTLKRLTPRLLFNDKASEQTFRNLSGSSISTLHISTHGFFRSSQKLNEAAADPANYDFNMARRFLASGRTQVSGLLLRQGNLSWQSQQILDDYDDLLTAEEIEMMNFPNLQLTVLSACDTGLGEIDSEGVWGLQRAFRIAGTKSLICSLKKVDDYWTALFMDAFYELAAQGKTIYDSFHTAQQWLSHELPDNPEIWSSLILIE